ncbi:TonB-dependent receptor [Rhodocytophaga rosea]|uniref:TonB-dependent receptor n=1 Tax=Rhodocytophaga rosea TaxID=2704465 RepID=A0A6C0GHZ3_9BACT|nr:TonB-dependent receptor [Rhodocytophaga rosea]QHT67681.1 TonB-dependent receptor [Rhodocytophaga rosea]
MKDYLPLPAFHALFFLLFTFAFHLSAIAQDTPQVYITGNYQNQPLQEVLADIEQKHPVRFFYQENWISGIRVQARFDKELLSSALQKILANTGLTFLSYDAYSVVLLRDTNAQVINRRDTTDIQIQSDTVTQSAATTPQPAGRTAGRRFGPDKSGVKVRISGYVREKSTAEPVLSATIYVQELKTGTVTDARGFYALVVPSGTYTITYNFIGYQQEKKELTLKTSQTIHVELTDQSIQMNEVTVWGEAADRNVSKPEMSVNRLDIKTIRKMPALMGEVDVVKSLLLLPGVTSVGEASTGFNVRGGSTDQNLILLDDAPVYNSSHLFGLFSVFNPDVVKDVTLYRGGIPSEFGGRISSVLDVTLKEATINKWSGKGGIGLVSNRLALEGPIIPDKLSIIAAARGTYADWILKQVPNQSVKGTQAHYYDTNVKIDYILNERNRISLSGYLGRDVYKLPADSIATVAINASSTVFRWGNSNATLRWSHAFNSRLFSNVTAVYSNYKSSIINPDGPNAFTLPSGIIYENVKADFNYFASDKHKIDLGASTIRYRIDPGSLKPEPGTVISPVSLTRENAMESALYISDEYNVSPAITVQYGLRYSVFQNLGPGPVYTYQEGMPREVFSIIDTTDYSSGQVTKQYQGVEPRLAVKIGLNPSSSVKLSYNRMRQYIHLISNTTAAAPTDRWKASSRYIKPQIGDQVAVGFFKNFFGNTFETSVEFYYKQIENIIDYKDGASLLLNQTVEADLLAGKGRAYGMELQVKKTIGKLTGWASYTYSRTQISVNGDYPEERINNGAYYPANYDKPHNINMVLTFQKNRRWNLSANFVYSTGRPVTYPESKYVVNGVSIANYYLRNQYRIPDYHRLDISATVDGNHRKNKKWDGSWTFSVYNVYSRDNAFSVFFKAKNGFLPEAYKLSIFASIFPSITYNFKF